MEEVRVRRGDILAGKYRVESVLGKGGMGLVVAATHLELLEPRAIKLMLPESLENKEAVERFMREARAASRLESEHVARVHDVGRLEGGEPYMVMEYLAGTDLRGLLEQRGRLPVSEAVGYALQASEALAEAHANGIVHRDLKPANLFLTARRDGSSCVKVLDFGISKVCGPSDPEMTTTQTMMGSPTYMSPEQMRSARSVDARSDVWSLGVILYRLVTGSPPFSAENLTELITRVLSTTPPPPSHLVPDVPKGFDEVLLRCLERDLDQRWSSVAELSFALAPFASEEAQASVDRITRLLAGKGLRSVPPAPRRTPSVSPEHAWATDDRISMRRWTFVAFSAIASGVGVAGAIAIALSLHQGAREAGMPIAHAGVLTEMPVSLAPQTTHVVVREAFSATPIVDVATADPAPPLAPKRVVATGEPSKTSARPAAMPRPTVKRDVPAPTAADKPAQLVDTRAPVSRHRMFDVEN